MARRRSRRIIMRTVGSEVGSRESRGQVRMGSRAAALRKARLRALALESLEARTLLAVLPPIIHDPSAQVPLNPSGVLDLAKAPSAPAGTATIAADNNNTSNESSPTIIINPANPQKLVAVWTRS